MSHNVVADPLPGSKRHYHILDGLRGVAAFMVVIYHIFEGWASSVETQWCNHGYLAVDFFFILSGFVVGYAYDDRWGKMGTGEFFKRRLIRLHPLVILGTVLGVVSFAIMGRHTWSGEQTSWVWVFAAMLSTFFLIPAAPGSPLDVRGNGELFSLNGPYWSLLCEYIGNILYALCLRRLSTRALSVVVALTGLAVATYALTNCSAHYHLGVGWTMTDGYLPAGLLIMTFCFAAGLLISRIFRPIKIRGAFWVGASIVMIATAMPRLGGSTMPWINGLYEAVCVVAIFPAVVWIGASGQTTDRRSTAICNFCGDISYPLYAVHYPLMYMFYAWVWNGGIAMSQGWPMAALVVASSIALAWIALKFYDAPIRKYLSAKFLKRR